jgi:apolipoprotein N-acyltransferase
MVMTQGLGVRGAVFFIFLGALTSLSFAPLGFFPIVFLSMPILVKALDYSKTKKRAFFVGGWFAFGLFSAGLYWVGFSFLAQSNIPHWAAPIAVMALAAALSVFVALSFVLAHKFWHQRPSRVLIFALCWVVFEWLRGNMFTGFPWHQMAQIWSNHTVVMQSVSLFGSSGLSFITVFVAASIVLVSDKSGSSRRSWLTSSMVLAIAVVGFGSIRLQQADVSYYPDVRLRLVQANISQVEKWPREFWQRNINQHIALSTENYGQNPPTHIIWPETAVPYQLHSSDEMRSIIMDGLGSNAYLVTGVPRVDRSSQASAEQKNDFRLYNSIIGIAPNGGVEMTYDKFHLVPFGEYTPFAGVLGKLGIEKFVDGAVGFSSGSGPQTHSLSGLPSFSPLICYEIIFPSSVRQNNKASWILNLTNDAWFGDSFGPYQHFAQARLRAVEEGVAIVRVAGTGISGVIDPWGRVVGKINLFEQGYLDSKLPKPTASETPYSKFGDMVFLFMVLLSMLNLVVLVKRAND